METSSKAPRPVTDAGAARVADIEGLCRLVSRHSFCTIPGTLVRTLVGPRLGLEADWDQFCDSWYRLPLDGYMADGGCYRRRRHATLSVDHATRRLKVEPHQPHYQSLAYNSLNGGIPRHFEPIEHAVLHGAPMWSLLALGVDLFSRLAPYSDWHIEVHQFRIEADGGTVAMPTPEGTHRDGVTFVMMIMVQRQNVVDGVTTIYDLAGGRLADFTLTDPLDTAITNDERVLHAVTPIGQLELAEKGHRDVLVVTFRHDN